MRMLAAQVPRSRAGAVLGKTPAGPATEDIRPASTDYGLDVLVGAATPEAALADNSDSSYLHSDTGGNGYAIWRGQMSPLLHAAGRGIASAQLIVRLAVPDDEAYLLAFPEDLAFFQSPETWFSNSPSIQNVSGPVLTKTGGGSWTEADINATYWSAQVGSGAVVQSTDRMYEVTARITYA